MNVDTSLPQDTADAKAARRESRRRRRSSGPSDPRGGAPAPQGAVQGDGESPEAEPTGLARIRSRLVGLWRRWVRPVLGVVSPIGWAVLGVAVAAWTAGLLLHVTELNVLALVLTVPLVIAAAFVLGRANYRVTLDLQSHRVVVGTRAVGRVEVANPTQRLILPSRIELAVGAATAQFLVPRLAPEQTHEELFAVPTRRRAVLVVGPVRSVRDDPLSLMRRQVTWARSQELYVHPRTVRLDEAASGFLRDLEGTPSSDLSSSDIAFHALRDYVPGDDRRHVHWRTTARTGKLMVRQFEETRRSHVVVALDDLRDHYSGEDEFELAVSAAASISAQTFREEKELTAFTVTANQRTAAFRPLMDDYTELDLLPGRHGLHELGQKAADLAPNASAVMLVVGAHASARELNAAATQLPLGVLAVAIRCVDGAEVRRSAIGGLDVVTLGALDDLPKALRAVGR